MRNLEEQTRYVLGNGTESLDPDVLPKEIDVMRYIGKIHTFGKIFFFFVRFLIN